MRRAVVAAVAVLVLGLGAGSARAGAAPVEGRWGGESPAGLPIYFAVAGGQVVDVRFTFRWGFCGTFELPGPSTGLTVDPSGHWGFDDPRGQTVDATFTAPDRADGKIVSVERMLPSCPRSEAAFTAAPLPPNPETLEAARRGIEALPYKIRLRTPPGVENALIGKAFVAGGKSFRFFLFVNRSAPKRLPGVPGYEVRGPNGSIHPGLVGGRLANTDVMFATVPGPGLTRLQKYRRQQILADVAKTICLRQTGAPCRSGAWAPSPPGG
jgi:hypothetical protein